MQHTEIILTEAHVKKIYDLKLGIHLNSARNSIDNFVNSANVQQRMKLDDAVDQYCKNMMAHYQLWIDTVQKYADSHGLTLEQAISVFMDEGEVKLKDLYYNSGFQNDAITRYRLTK